MRGAQRAKVDRQVQALKFIKVRINSEGEPPTIQEIAKHLGVSISTAASYVDRLESSRMITRVKHVSRGIRILEPFDQIT